MLKILLSISFCFLVSAAIAQPGQRIALTNLEQAKTVESSKAGQIPLSNTDGNLRYAQFTEIDLNPIAFIPASTGNTTHYSEFVTAPDGNLYYIDWQGRGTLISSTASGDTWNEEYFGSVTGNNITAAGTLPTSNTTKRVVLYRSGVKMREGVDYSLSGNTITLVVGGLAESFTIRYR
jgi:hypothetical protein